MVSSRSSRPNGGYDLNTKKNVTVCVCYLVFNAVPSKHVFDVVQEVTDGVHIGQVFNVLVHSLKHLIKRHSNLRGRNTLISNDLII